MPDNELTPNEIKRSLARIETQLDNVSATLDDLNGKVLNDFYHLRDHEQRLTRLERLTTAVASAVALAILAAIIQMVL